MVPLPSSVPHPPDPALAATTATAAAAAPLPPTAGTTTAGPAAADPAGASPASPPEGVLLRWLRVNPRYQAAAFVTVTAALVLATVSLAYLCWFLWLARLWSWGFEPLTWRSIFSVFGGFYLLLAPLMPFFMGKEVLGSLLGLSADAREQHVKETLAQLDVSKALTEDALAAEDTSGLIPLVRYSRLELESYYTIALAQTQRSFRYSVMAMWIGFAIIAGGIAMYAFPVGPRGTAADVNLLAIASGTVVEVIAALFLWIYRSSIGQLTYFYNRQMYLHGVAVAMRIAESMDEADSTKRLIVEKMLDPRSHGQPRGPALPLLRGASPDAGAPAAP